MSQVQRSSRTGKIPAWGVVIILLITIFVGIVIIASMNMQFSGDVPKLSRTTSRGASAAELRYVDEASCNACHPGEAAQHSKSGHHWTLRNARTPRVIDLVAGKKLEDPEFAGVSWEFARNGSDLELIRRQKDQEERSIVDYSIGAGNHAMTFVTVKGQETPTPTGTEHRVSYYTQTRSLAITPGQTSTAASAGLTSARDAHQGRSRNLSTEELFKCFGCHTTGTPRQNLGTFTWNDLRPGVNCQECHGPASAHLEAAALGEKATPESLAMPFGHEGAPAKELIRMCGRCHRLPEDFDHEVIRHDNLALIRFQPVGLQQSACFTNDPEGLSCIRCHDPHGRLQHDQTHYEAVCLSCHQGNAAGRTCRVSPKKDCISCHMPKKDAGQRIPFTDHWIRVHRVR